MSNLTWKSTATSPSWSQTCNVWRMAFTYETKDVLQCVNVNVDLWTMLLPKSITLNAGMVWYYRISNVFVTCWQRRSLVPSSWRPCCVETPAYQRRTLMWRHVELFTVRGQTLPTVTSTDRLIQRYIHVIARLSGNVWRRSWGRPQLTKCFVCPMLCNAWTECVCIGVCMCVRHTFCQLAYRSDPSTDFYRW